MNIIANVHMAEQEIEKIFAEVCTNKMLTVRRAVLLQAIDEAPGASQTVLTQGTGIDRSTLAQMVRRLEQLHLVKRVRDKKDQRAYVVTLTAGGRKLCVAGATAIEATAGKLLERLPKLKALA